MSDMSFFASPQSGLTPIRTHTASSVITTSSGGCLYALTSLTSFLLSDLSASTDA